MPKELIYIVFLLLLPWGVSAQKDTGQVMDASGLEAIDIFTNEVYRITLVSANTQTVRVKTHSEGEYYNRISLEYKRDGDRLKVSSEYPEILTGGFDKLSAHKVFSLEVVMEIPEGLEVNIISNLASVEAEGHYKLLMAELKEGYCHLKNFTGDAVVNTFNGAIEVETSGARLEAHTRNGNLDVPENMYGRNLIRLKSIDGDIRVRKN